MSARRFLTAVFHASPVLVLTASAMVLDLGVCALGLLSDKTLITGAPAWAKPTKFAISTGVYALSVAAIVRSTPTWPRTLRIMEAATGLALLTEIVLIDLQAARHTTSHFNVATTLDRNIFIVMGIGIAILWVSAAVITVATFRTRYKSPAWTIAVRYGMLLALLGASTGAFMAPPSRAQREAAERSHHMTVSGSHTIGGPDGGRGLPFLNWSVEHGDVRIAHFLGLHGLQFLALAAFSFDRKDVSERAAQRFVTVAAMSYGGLFVLTLFGALSAVPVTSTKPAAVTAWGAWAALTGTATAWSIRNKLRTA